MTTADASTAYLNRIQRRALVVGCVSLLGCLAGAVVSPAQFFQSYLVAYLFWMGIALGSLAVVMLHHLVGGGWGIVIRRFLESGTRTLPLMLLLLAPLVFGLPHLFVWARPEVVAADELLQHKSAYLNVPFFLARTAFYFALWIGFQYLLNKWSVEEEESQLLSIRRRLSRVSGPGLVLYGFTVTFASVDWVMSLEPHWFSTVYGILFMVSQVLTTLAFAITALLLLGDRKPLSGILTRQHFHDLGNLLLAFVMLWAYISFSQFLIVWSGNLPEEIPWYISRLHGGWGWIASLLVVAHFALPMLLLLSRQNKRDIRVLGSLAIGILVIRLVDLFWIVTPAFHGEGLHVHWMDVAAPVGVGGIWIAAFIWQLKTRPLLPLQVDRPTPEHAS